MKIYLIGMPLSGKSVVGELLANALNMGFIDTDHVIESTYKKTIADIFSLEGEDIFRTYEKEVLQSLHSKDDLIISTGGGIVLDRTNKQLMNGIIFYLDVPLPVLESREHNSFTRPLLKKKTLKQLYEERKKYYRYFQTFTIQTEEVVKSVDLIIDKLKGEQLL